MADYPEKSDYCPRMTEAGFDPSRWRKARRSEPNGGNCVEVNRGRPGLVGVRDSKLVRSPVITYPAPAWRAFLTRLGRR